MRRLISISMVVLGALIAPLLLPLGLFAPTGVRAVLMVWAWLCIECAGLVAAAVMRPSNVEGHYRLQRWWSARLWAALSGLYRLRVQVDGETGPGPFLLLVRHASTADTLLPAVLVANPQKRRLRYVLKDELRWDPCLGLVGERLPNAFVRRGQGDVDRIAALARDMGQDGVVLWPEGTRFRPHKAKPPFKHTLAPRTGGVLTVLEQTPMDVVFCAHTGFEGVRRMSDLWNGTLLDQTVHVKLWRATPPRDDRDAWLQEQWLDVDAFVGAHAHPAPTE